MVLLFLPPQDLMQSQEDECACIAKNLHDSVGQQLILTPTPGAGTRFHEYFNEQYCKRSTLDLQKALSCNHLMIKSSCSQKQEKNEQGERKQ